ncbi:hypothetical protein JCM11491_000853 [Sporobolomyces phaffii]
MALTRRSGMLETCVAMLALFGMVRGHMELKLPYAVYSKLDPQTQEADKDYSMTSPLEKDGSNYPAKKRCTSEVLSALTPVATLVSGEEFEWNLAGTAVHNGGSCQVGITYDNCATIAVMASYIGGCPLSLYKFKVPDLPGADKAFFVWAWSNRSGNRELYQNVAVVAVQGSASEFTGPSMFRANTFGGGVCVNPEGTDVVYPAPGDQVFYGGDYSDGSPPSAAKLDCPGHDNSATVTVKNGGGGSGPTGGGGGGGGGGGSGGGDDDKTKTKDENEATPTSGGTTGTDGDSGATATPKEAGTATSSKSSSAAAATSSGGSSSSNDADDGAGGARNAAPSSKPSTVGSSSSSSTPSSPLSAENSANFIKFGLAFVAIVLVTGVCVFIAKRRSTKAHYSHANDSSDEYDSDSSEDDYGGKVERRT